MKALGGVGSILHRYTQQHRSKMGTIPPLEMMVEKASFLIFQRRDLMIVFLAAVSHEGCVEQGARYPPQGYPATSVQDEYDPPAGNNGRESYPFSWFN